MNSTGGQRHVFKICSWSALTALAAWAFSARADGPIMLRDVTRHTEIQFQHTDGGSGLRYIVETFASGLATVDFDGDGLMDIYFLNGSPLRGTKMDQQPTNALYRNLGGFTFVDVTDQAGVGDVGFGLGVTVGDYDNDGFGDLFVNNFGPNVLYRNNGDGTYSQVTLSAGLGGNDTVGAGANFLDMDSDGNLDLFVANYVGFNYENHVTTTIRGAPWYAGPLDFPPQSNQLFRNNGDGTFTDVSNASGITAHPGSAMGTICIDFDTDGHTDIFVCNDERLDFLFRNDGKGRFEEVGLLAGVACNFAGEQVGSMGADCADYDRDGKLDLFVTAFEQQKPILFRNLGSGTFEDLTMQAGAAVGSYAHVKWGGAFADFDNDGYPDLWIGCGHLGERFDEFGSRTTSYRVRPVLLWNNGRGRFVDVSELSGDVGNTKLVARGVALEDMDNDGRVDVVVLNSRQGATVLRNESSTRHHWAQFLLRGVQTNRDGVGALVTVVSGDFAQVAEVHSGRSYQSHYGSRLSFGLGNRHRVDRVEVRWIGGGTDIFEDLPVDQCVTLIEGTSAERRAAN
jgi:enediyne biosynthesis protein E4